MKQTLVDIFFTFYFFSIVAKYRYQKFTINKNKTKSAAVGTLKKDSMAITSASERQQRQKEDNKKKIEKMQTNNLLHVR